MRIAANRKWWSGRNAVGPLLEWMTAVNGVLPVGGCESHVRLWRWYCDPQDGQSIAHILRNGSVWMDEVVRVDSTDTGLCSIGDLLRWSDGEWSLGRLHGIGCISDTGYVSRVTLDVPDGWPVVSVEGQPGITALVEWTADDILYRMLWGRAVPADWYTDEGERIGSPFAARPPAPEIVPPCSPSTSSERSL